MTIVRDRDTAADIDDNDMTDNNVNVNIDTLDVRAINRSAMSRALSVDLAHVSRILSGQRTPSFDLAKRMSIYLGLTLDDYWTLLDRIKAEQRERKSCRLHTPHRGED